MCHFVPLRTAWKGLVGPATVYMVVLCIEVSTLQYILDSGLHMEELSVSLYPVTCA